MPLKNSPESPRTSSALCSPLAPPLSSGCCVLSSHNRATDTREWEGRSTMGTRARERELRMLDRFQLKAFGLYHKFCCFTTTLCWSFNTFEKSVSHCCCTITLTIKVSWYVTQLCHKSPPHQLQVGQVGELRARSTLDCCQPGYRASRLFALELFCMFKGV